MTEHCNQQQEAQQFVGQGKTLRQYKILPKAVGRGILGRLL